MRSATAAQPVGNKYSPLHRLVMLTSMLLILLFIPTSASACITCEIDPFAVWDSLPADKELTLADRASLWIIQTQRNLHHRLATALERLRTAPSAQSMAALIILGFLYGVLHAAGPGHGKAIISTYLLTHRQDLIRGIGLSISAALLQGVTAILLVLSMVGVLGLLAGDALAQVYYLELFSFLLISLLGIWLCIRALRTIWLLRKPKAQMQAVVLAATNSQAPFTMPSPTHDPQAKIMTSSHAMPGQSCGCGAKHHVDINERGPWLTAILAIGIRPCTGAVVVMAIATMLGMWLAGVVAVLAISAGTAITVSVIAALAVYARDWTTHRFANDRDSQAMRFAGATIGLVGGSTILLLGLVLFNGLLSLDPSHYLAVM